MILKLQDNPLLFDMNVQKRVNDFIDAALTQVSILFYFQMINFSNYAIYVLLGDIFVFGSKTVKWKLNRKQWLVNIYVTEKQDKL